MGLLSFLFGCKKDSKAPAKTDFQEVSHVNLKATHKYTSTENLSEEQIFAYFKEILQTEFPEYEVKEQVKVTVLAGYANDSFQLYKTRPYQVYKAEWGEPYSFVMYRDNAVKGVVMIGAKNSHDTKVKFLVSRMYAKKLNIPYINFYTHFSNNIEYVVTRIDKMLKK